MKGLGSLAFNFQVLFLNGHHKKTSMCVVLCILYTVNNNIFGGGDDLDCGYGQALV